MISVLTGQIKVENTVKKMPLWKMTCSLYSMFCVCLQGYEVRKITAIDQDLGRPRGIGYTIISGLSHIINLTSTAQRRESITSYHNPTAIIDKSHQAQQSITAESRASELENSFARKHLLITFSCSCAEVSRHLVFLVVSCRQNRITVWQCDKFYLQQKSVIYLVL